jgi:uncharacterized protein (DUF924 family)
MTSTIMVTPSDLLQFWFGGEYGLMDKMDDVKYIESRMPLWFGRASSDFDEAQCGNRGLLKLPADASVVDESSKFDDSWALVDPQTCIARVILFDQFPRCIFRGTSAAFQYEDQAIASVQTILTNGWLDCQIPIYSQIEIFFITVALQHSEVLQLQKAGFDAANKLLLTLPQYDGSANSSSCSTKETLVAYFKSLKGFPDEHYDCIVQFGRFPSRNNALVSLQLL